MSRTLVSSERYYSQIVKEALALIYGDKYFHKYLYGSKFVLVTDHKPFLAVYWDQIVESLLLLLHGYNGGHSY